MEINTIPCCTALLPQASLKKFGAIKTTGLLRNGRRRVLEDEGGVGEVESYKN